MDSSLELECAAVGVPPPTLSWLKDGRPLEGTDIVQEDGHFVRISKVQVNCKLTISENIKKDAKNHWHSNRLRSLNAISPGSTVTLRLINVVSLKVKDAGLYTCLASSPAGEDGKNHWVRVQGDRSCSCAVQNLSLIPLLYLHLGLDIYYTFRS